MSTPVHPVATPLNLRNIEITVGGVALWLAEVVA